MKTIERELANSQNANILAGDAATFANMIPAGIDTDSILEIGDVIVIPAVFKVKQQIFNEKTYEFIVASVINTAGQVRAINFFPTTLVKRLFPAVMQDGQVKVQQPTCPKGTAVDLFTSFRCKTGDNGETDLQLAMTALQAEKYIKITDKTTIQTRRYDQGTPLNELRDVAWLTYDLVQDPVERAKLDGIKLD